jgi:hypothetical protein
MAGVVETTNTFATNDVITSTAMNNIIDQTLFTSDAIVATNTTLALVAGKLKVGTITSNEMGVGAVTANALASDAVTTVKILDANVTTAKIADSAVTTAKITDANVTTAKIADASITAPKLNGAQTGTAPIYGCRAWVNFNGTTAANISGSYVRAGTTVTVTITSHGLLVGHQVYLDFTTGAAVDGVFVVTSVADVNTFTVTHGTSGSTSGSVTVQLRQIRQSGNVSNVSFVSTGNFIINFTSPMPTATYQVNGTASGNSSHPSLGVSQAYDSTATESSLRIYTGPTGGSGAVGFLDNPNYANISVFG